MKKTFTLLILMSTLLSFYAHSAIVYVDRLKYNTNTENLTAILIGYDTNYWGYKKPSGELVIPSTITVESVKYTVTSIGAAFDGCSGLTGTLTIPNTVTSIGDSAFDGCSGFTGELTIPSSVTSIGNNAFSGCSGFTGELTIPTSVKSIGYNAFSYCSGFTGDLIIPNSITSIGSLAFNGFSHIDKIIIENSTPCSIENHSFPSNKFIYVPSGSLKAYLADAAWSGYEYLMEIGTDVELNITLTAPNTLLAEVKKASSDPTKVNRLTITGELGVDDWKSLNIDFTKLYYLDLSQVTNTEIPGEVFWGNTLLQTIIFPNNLLSIGWAAFNSCSGFTGDLTIPNSVTSIGGYAFYDCSCFTGNLTIGNSVKSIGESAFSGCSGLTGDLTIPNSVTSIGKFAFNDCNNITGDLTIPNSVTSIGNHAFYGCRGFSGELTIPNSVESIEEGTFLDCRGLIGDLTIPNSVKSIGKNAFYYCSGFIGNLTIGNSVTSIDEGAFYECSGLTGDLTIPNSVTSIGENAFYDCSGLTGNLTIPNSVKSIGEMAFSGCRGFKGNLTIGNSVTTIGKNAFSTYSGFTGELTIPNSVVSIGSGAFSGCDNVDRFIIEDSTPCTIENYNYVFPENKFIYVPIGALDAYKAAPNWSSYKYLMEIGTDIELDITLSAPNTLLAEVTKASSDPAKVNRITITGELGDDDWALLKSDFSMLYYLDLSQATNTEIPSSALKYNKLLQTIILPNNLLSIGDDAFYYCCGLTGNLTIPNSVTSIGAGAFYECKGFTGDLIIPNSVISIGDDAFYNCRGFTGDDLTIPNSVTSIGERAFYTCNGFTRNLTIGNSVISIGKDAFFPCYKFTGNLTIGNSVTSIENGAFGNGKNFSKIISTATTPPSCVNDCFSVDTEICILNVPTGSLTNYSSANVWKDFSNIVGYTDKIIATTDNTLDLKSDMGTYLNIVIEDGAEINAEGNDQITILDALTIERSFTYTDGKGSNEQWFNLGLPFAAVANSALVQKYNPETHEYEPAVCGVDYATASYNGARRAENGFNSDGSNWDLQFTEEGQPLGELIQFAETGTHKYRFISPSAQEAKAALKTGRTGSTYYNTDMEQGGKNGWNIVPAGKTYSTKDNYAILEGLATIQQFDGVNKFTAINKAEITTLAPGTVFGVQLTEAFAATQSTPASNGDSDAAVERYRFDLVDVDGAVLDRIYMYDGSNHVKYRLGKMSAMSGDVAQMAIKVDGGSYCTYSTLASELNKEYQVSLTNATGASLVMKTAGSQTVTIDGEAVAIDTPIAVEDGDIVIKIGSAVTNVYDMQSAISVTGGNSTISISGAEAATPYAIITMTGITTHGTTTAATTRVEKPAGVYIVKINNSATKVIVK